MFRVSDHRVVSVSALLCVSDHQVTTELCVTAASRRRVLLMQRSRAVEGPFSKPGVGQNEALAENLLLRKLSLKPGLGQNIALAETIGLPTTL